MSISAALFSVTALGCATSGTVKPARLMASDGATMTIVRETLAKAVGRPRIELGPENLATSTIITVLPPPLGLYDTRSLAVPSVFDIKIQGGTCVLIARDGGKIHPLTGAKCVVAP